MFRLLTCLAVLVAGQVQAGIMQMDFQSQPVSAAPMTYSENGIRLVSAGAVVTLFNIGNPTPGYANLTDSPNSFTFDLLTGDPFELLSFDIETARIVTVEIVGNLSGGGTISESFLVDTPENIFATFSPSLDFSSLESFVINVPSGAGVTYVDNIRVSDAPVGTVPEPTSLAIFGALGMAGFAAGRKRKQNT